MEELKKLVREFPENKALKEIRELGLDNDEAHLELGRIYREKGEYDKALDELKTALNHNSSNAYVCFEMGKIYRERKNYDLAIKEFKEAVNKGLETEEIHIKLGQLYREKEKYDLSTGEFKKAIELSPLKDSPFFKNTILNEIEITQKKTVLESKPRGLGITLTTRCNLRCTMCKIRETLWDIPEKLVKEIVGCFPCLQYIMWLGGEVFYSNYFEELFEKAAVYPNLDQAIFTNGVLIDERWAKKLVEANVKLSYSIDGFTKKTYESIRVGARFEDLLKSIDYINKYRHKNDMRYSKEFSTGINFTVMKSNYHEIEEAIDFAIRYAFNLLTINFVDVGDPKDIFFYKDFKAADYIKKVIPEVQSKAKSSGITLNVFLPKIKSSSHRENTDSWQKEQRSDYEESAHVAKIKGILCYLPWQHLFIDPGGKVKTFCLCKKEIGDIYKNSLEEIWNNKMMQFYRQKLVDSNYRDLCNYRCISGAIPKHELRLEYNNIRSIYDR